MTCRGGPEGGAACRLLPAASWRAGRWWLHVAARSDPDCNDRDRRRAGESVAGSGGGGAASRGAGADVADGIRFQLAARLPAGLGAVEFRLDRGAAPAGVVRRAVADHGGAAGAAVAAEARCRADDREFRRPDGGRPRHRRLPVHDLPGPALERDRRRGAGAAADVRAVVARSVPDQAAAGRGRRAALPRRAGRLRADLAGGAVARLFRRRLSVEIRPLRRQCGVGFLSIRLHGIRRGQRRAAEDSAGGCLPSGRHPPAYHHDPRRILVRYPHRRAGEGARRLRRAFPVVRRQGAQIPRREQWRAELVHRIQRAGGTVVALVRAVRLFRHPDRGGAGRARPAAGAAALRLFHRGAVSRQRRLHERAQLPVHHRDAALLRRHATSAPPRSSPTASSTTTRCRCWRSSRSASRPSPSSISPPIIFPGRSNSAPI